MDGTTMIDVLGAIFSLLMVLAIYTAPHWLDYIIMPLAASPERYKHWRETCKSIREIKREIKQLEAQKHEV